MRPGRDVFAIPRMLSCGWWQRLGLPCVTDAFAMAERRGAWAAVMPGVPRPQKAEFLFQTIVFSFWPSFVCALTLTKFRVAGWPKVIKLGDSALNSAVYRSRLGSAENGANLTKR